jgi:hypothetical protein
LLADDITPEAVAALLAEQGRSSRRRLTNCPQRGDDLPLSNPK